MCEFRSDFFNNTVTKLRKIVLALLYRRKNDLTSYCLANCSRILPWCGRAYGSEIRGFVIADTVFQMKIFNCGTIFI